MKEARTVCPNCGAYHRSVHPGWVCMACEPEVTVEAVSALLVDIQRRSQPLATCKYDGCLLAAGEACPACRARQPQRGQESAPPGWIRKGGVYVSKSRRSRRADS